MPAKYIGEGRTADADGTDETGGFEKYKEQGVGGGKRTDGCLFELPER